jgi:outer membrane protein OmpA-like peptidoglycan-associated protein/tetratricopeptide (TPR) repeat protein
MNSINKFLLIFLSGLIAACTVTKKVKTGEDAYRYKQYKLATELLEQEYNASNDNRLKARMAYLAAHSYDNLQLFGDALQWYDTADQLGYNAETETELAYSLKRNERYEDAYQLFSDIYKKNRDQKIRTEIELCRIAAETLKETPNTIISPFSVNTKYSDYAAVYYEENFIVFTSDRQGSTGNGIYKWNDRPYSDLFIVNRKGRNLYNFDSSINTASNEGTVAFNKDFDEIFFTRCVSTDSRDQHCKIFYSLKPNDFWVEPEVMPFFSDGTNYGHPTLIENDSVLVFSVSTPDSDNHDLYYSVRLENGWSEAELMPSSINTTGDEKFPTSHVDTLYFSSDGHPGYGGLDIFKTYLKPDGSWATPTNVGFPINSGSDDFSLAVDPQFKEKNNIKLQGHFSSSRNTGMGDDIFSFTEYMDDEDVKESDEPIEDDIKNFKIYLAARVVEVVHKDDDPNKKIIDKKRLPNSRIEFISSDTTFFATTDDSGRLLLELSEAEYLLIASSQDYLANKIDVDSKYASTNADTTINVEIPLDKIIYNKEITLQNIYYDFEKWDIREDAKPSLDSLYNILLYNTDINIQLSSHTDCRGALVFNKDLSQKRAQSAVSYLVQKGIAKDRLSAVGYGETRPAINCNCDDCTEDQHQTNRRTTFTILQ